MQRMSLIAFGIVAAIVGSFVTGCGGAPEKPVPVSGRVTVGGEPVANVAVHFIALGKNHVGTGRTAADGSFTLENGALPGVNKVYFAPIRELPPGVDETAFVGGEDAPPVEIPVPPEYTDPLNPKLEFTVPAGGTKEANFDLPRK